MSSGNLVTAINVSSEENKISWTGSRTTKYHVDDPFNFVCDLFSLVQRPFIHDSDPYCFMLNNLKYIKYITQNYNWLYCELYVEVL